MGHQFPVQDGSWKAEFSGIRNTSSTAIQNLNLQLYLKFKGNGGRSSVQRRSDQCWRSPGRCQEPAHRWLLPRELHSWGERSGAFLSVFLLNFFVFCDFCLFKTSICSLPINISSQALKASKEKVYLLISKVDLQSWIKTTESIQLLKHVNGFPSLASKSGKISDKVLFCVWLLSSIHRRFKFQRWERKLVRCCRWCGWGPLFPASSLQPSRLKVVAEKFVAAGGQPVPVWDQPLPHLHSNGPLQAAVQGAPLYLGGRTDQVNRDQPELYTVKTQCWSLRFSISCHSFQAAAQREPDQGSCGAWVQHRWRRGRGRDLYLLHPCRRACGRVWTGKKY